MALEHNYIKAPSKHRIEDTPTGHFYIFEGDDGELTLSQNALEISQDGILLRTFAETNHDFASTWSYSTDEQEQSFYTISANNKEKLLELTSSLRHHKFRPLELPQCSKELIVDCYRCKFIIPANFILSEEFDVGFMLDKRYKLINEELSSEGKDFNVQFKILIYAVFDVVEDIIEYLPYRTQFCDIVAFFLFLIVSQSTEEFDYTITTSKVKESVLAFLYSNRRLIDHFQNLEHLHKCVCKEFKKNLQNYEKECETSLYSKNGSDTLDSCSITRFDMIASCLESICCDDYLFRSLVNKVFQLSSQFFTRYLNPDLTILCLCKIVQEQPFAKANEMIALAVRIIFLSMSNLKLGNLSHLDICEEMVEAINDLTEISPENIIKEQ